MFTTGSKLLIGSAFAAALFALVYGVTQDGSLGTIGLISAAVGLGAARRDQRLRTRLERLGDGARGVRSLGRPPATAPARACGRC
jgi:hypothetical protein